MKKFTSLLALFLMVLGINAQEKVNVIKQLGENMTELTQLEDGKYYAFFNTSRKGWLHQKMDKTLYLGQDPTVGSGSEYIWQAHKIADSKFSFTSAYGDYVPFVTQGGETKGVAANHENKGEFIVSKKGDFWLLKNTKDDERWNGNDGGGHWWFTGWNDEGKNSQYRIHPVEVNLVDQVKVTYNFINNGNIIRTEQVYQIPGSDYYLPQFAAENYTHTDAVSGKVVIGQENIVNVLTRVELPFEVTTDTAHPKWQILDNHNTQATPLFVFVDKSQNNKVVLNASASGKFNTMSDFVEDGYYWCFVGNPHDGFKIYNKALGFDFALTNSADAASMIAAAEASSWKVVPSTEGSPAGFALTADGKNYLNHHQDTQTLHYYSKADGGSSFRPFVIGNMATANSACVPGAVGGYKYFNETANVEKFNKAHNALLANPYEYAVAKAYADVVAEAQATEFDATIKVQANKMYRFKNACRNVSVDNNNHLGFGAFMGTTPYTVPNFEGQSCDITAGTVKIDDPSTVWVLEAEGQNFKIKNLNTGKYIGATDPQNGSVYLKLADNASAGIYQVKELGKAQFAFVCVSENVGSNKELHLSGLGVMNYNDQNGTKGDDASSWYLLPASELEVEATEGWSSLYLPFGVKMPEGVKAYAGTVDAPNNRLMLNEFAAGVPAATGAILKSTSDKMILTIADVPAVAEGFANDLVGTNSKINKVAGSLVLGKGAQGFGMYAPMGDFMKANKAYVDPAKVPAAGVNALAFGFGDVTGVDNVEVAVPADNVYYDLSGRRVAHPVKGIYIVNGKKVYVK